MPTPATKTTRTGRRKAPTLPHTGPGGGLTKAGYRRRAFLQAVMVDAGARLDRLDVPDIGQPGNAKIGTAGRHGLALVYSGLAWHDCPGRTPACGAICYAEKFRFLDAVQKRRGARHLYSYMARHNLGMLREIVTLEITRHAGRARLRGLRAVVRIHEAGDFLSPAHALMWAEVARAFPDVNFWFYTRSHNAGPLLDTAIRALANLPNVHGRASHDPEEIPAGLGAGTSFPAALIVGSVHKGKRKGAAAVPGAVNCPEQLTGGAVNCVDCGLCWHPSKPPIRFYLH